MYSMGSGEGMKKHVPKVRFEPCAEAKAVGLEIAKEESLSRAAFLNIRLSIMVACIARRVARRLRWGWLCWLTRPGNY